VLVYLKDPALAVREMLRVLRPGGGLALIEPDYSTTTVNLPDRPALRRVLAHDADTAVRQSWLPGPLAGILADLGFSDIARATRVLVFPQELGAIYFMTPEALRYLDRSQGFQIGADASVAVVNEGVAVDANSSTLQQPIVAIVFGQQGLMAGAVIAGSKISRIHPK
jgi:hypothetical protein